MVLNRAALLVVAAACNQSLFDAGGRPDGGGGSPDVAVPSACPSPCIGDAAADFDGTPNGAGGRWRFLDDRRDRTWAAMTPESGGLVGANPANAIATCAGDPSAEACAALPDALLVSTAGMTAAADPAIAFPAPAAQEIQVSVRVHVPAGSPDQVVRLYRNSREDVLATATATAGTTLDRAIVVDALPGDRFHVAFAPAGAGAAKIGVHVFVNSTAATFPSKCQLAVSFAAAAGTMVDNLCGADLGHENYNTGPSAPTLGAAPFGELGMGADVTPDNYYSSNAVLEKSGDFTVQLWIKLDGLVSPYTAWPFSDLDLESEGGAGATGGIGIGIYEQSGLQIVATTCTADIPQLAFEEQPSPYPPDGAWHFVRVVHAGGLVKLCLDGTLRSSYPLAAGKLASNYAPRLGRNVIWTPSGAFLDGGIDDVRVFSTALPCD